MNTGKPCRQLKCPFKHTTQEMAKFKKQAATAEEESKGVTPDVQPE